jgi:signal transduction histidine kinase
MCLVLARADASQPLAVIGSRGYSARKAHSLVMWPEEEPWASALNRDRVVEIETDEMEPTWREVLGSGRILLVPVRWQGWVRSALMFPADVGKTGGTHLVDPAQLGSVGAQAGLLYQNAELIQRLRRDEEVLQGLMQRSIQVQEEERRRIASDIHDGVTQRIVGIWYQLLALEKRLKLPEGPSEVRVALETIKAQVELTMQEARAAIYNLRPSTLDDLGLIPSLRSLAHDFRSETGVEVDLEVRGERRLPDYVEVGIYRIAQEALRNIKKHARASMARLLLDLGEERVKLTVTDNGRGFQRKKRGGGRLTSFGLESMEERAQMLGAQLFVRSTPGDGTSVRVSIPIPREEP